MNTRGVSPVLGVTLLLALTLVAALGMLAVGATVLDGTQSSAETRQIEQSLSSFASDAERIAHGDAAQAPYRIQSAPRQSASVDAEAGSYEVRVERPNGTEVLTRGDLGAYRIAEADGTTVAFQGGGVWRKEADENAQVVSPPQFHYRAEPEPTLTLPIVRVNGSHGPAPASGAIVVQERRTRYPVRPNHTNPLQTGVVFLEVQSEYCAGWEDFFRDRTDGAVVESCEERGDTESGEVLVQLSVPFHFDGLNGRTVIADSVTGKPGNVHGSTSGGVSELPSVSGVVERNVERCRDGEGQPYGHVVSGGGLYCSSGVDGGYEVKTRGEDVEIVVNGTANFRDLQIQGDGTVTVFANGNVLQLPGNRIGDPGDPEQLRLLVHSDYRVGEAPGGHPGGGGGRGGPGAGHVNIYALIYAPNSVVAFAGNADIYGGVVARRVHLQSGSTSVQPDAAVGRIELEYERGGEPFYYLHVSETAVTVEE